MTVMDKVEGWNEEKWVGTKFAACMWVYTEAVLCDGQGPTQEGLRRRLSTIRESVSWVCEDALWEHEWVTELDVILEENEILEALNYDLDVPCSIQWGLVVLLTLATQSNIPKRWHKHRKVPCCGEHGHNAIQKYTHH